MQLRGKVRSQVQLGNEEALALLHGGELIAHKLAEILRLFLHVGDEIGGALLKENHKTEREDQKDRQPD